MDEREGGERFRFLASFRHFFLRPSDHVVRQQCVTPDRQRTQQRTKQTLASGVPCHLTNSQSTPNAGALEASPKERRRICSLVRQPLIWRLRLVVGSCEETDYPTTFSQGVIYQTAPTPKWKGFFLLSSARSLPPRGKKRTESGMEKEGGKRNNTRSFGRWKKCVGCA